MAIIGIEEIFLKVKDMEKALLEGGRYRAHCDAGGESRPPYQTQTMRYSTLLFYTVLALGVGV